MKSSKMELKPTTDSLIFCAIILMVGIYGVVLDSAGQVVTLTIARLNNSESQLLNTGCGICLNGCCR